MKKDGGLLIGWQLHHLDCSEATKQVVKRECPDVIVDPQPMMVTGTVHDSPTRPKGQTYHTRTSLVVKIDRENKFIETKNTIYRIDPDTEGQDVMPDLGNGVLSVFY